MHVIQAIELEKVGPYQKPVRFEPPCGVSTIYGLNRAAGKASQNSNGVGKSLLFSVLPEVMYDEPQIGERSDKIKQGRRDIEFMSHAGKKVLVRRIMRGKTDKLEIHVNGKDKEIRTVAEAKKTLSRLFPITASAYRTYISIDSTVPHPLVRGTGTERKAFLTEFFDLDKMDAERKLYAAELTKLGKVRAAYDELRAQVERDREGLVPRDELMKLKERVTKIKARLSKLQRSFTDAQEITRLVAFSESMGDQVKILQGAIGDEITEESFIDHVKQIKYEFDTTAANIEEAEEYEQYKKNNARYNEAYAELSEVTQNLIEENGRELAAEMAKNAYTAYTEARLALKRVELEIESVREEAESELPEKADKPEEEEADLETLVRVYEHQLEHAEKFAEGKCESCGQAVKIKDPATLKKRLKAAQQKLKQHAQYEAYRKARAAQTRAEVRLAELEKEQSCLVKNQKKFRALAKAHKEMLELPREPKPFEGKKLELKVLRRMMEELVERRFPSV